jgi:hypothetical protein
MYNCMTCNGTGTVFAYRLNEERGAPYVFNCSCVESVGLWKTDRRFGTWSSELGRTYYLAHDKDAILATDTVLNGKRREGCFRVGDFKSAEWEDVVKFFGREECVAAYKAWKANQG